MKANNFLQAIAAVLLLHTSLSASAQESATPLWQGVGRIALSSDGNEHDHDDWAATPLSLALLASQGLQDAVTLYTYSDHVWGSNHDFPGSDTTSSSYDNMQESAMGSKLWFGFNDTKFVCAVDDPKAAYKAMAKEINASSKENPLIIIAAGPMQVVGEGINRSKVSKRQYVTVVSHSGWNNNHSDKPEEWEEHSGWRWNEMKSKFGTTEGGGVKFVQIKGQNSGKDYKGLYCPKEDYDWIKTSEARNDIKTYKPGAWDFLYQRVSSCVKKGGKYFDPSDAGMVIYMLTGEDRTNPDMAREIMENPNQR